MNVLLCLNGSVNTHWLQARLSASHDFIIAVDGGLQLLAKLNLIPDRVIGDLDSADQQHLDSLPASCRIDRFPAFKDQTDFELALAYLLSLHDSQDGGIAGVSVIGSNGGRIDQMLGNYLILGSRSWPFSIEVLDEYGVAYVVNASLPLTLACEKAQVVSLLAVSDNVTGVTTTGLQYSLKNEPLPLGSSRGISNVAEDTSIEVSVESGTVLAIVNP